MPDVDLHDTGPKTLEGDVTLGQDGNLYVLTATQVIVISQSGEVIRKIKFDKSFSNQIAEGIKVSNGLVAITLSTIEKNRPQSRYLVVDSMTGQLFGLYELADTNKMMLCLLIDRKDSLFSVAIRQEPGSSVMRSADASIPVTVVNGSCCGKTLFDGLLRKNIASGCSINDLLALGTHFRSPVFRENGLFQQQRALSLTIPEWHSWWYGDLSSRNWYCGLRPTLWRAAGVGMPFVGAFSANGCFWAG